MICRMVLVNGFLLGLASGGACLAYCAPVLIPYLMGEGRSIRGNALLVGGFLGGRLVGYLAFAVLAWAAHIAVGEDLPCRALATGIVTIVLAVLLIAYGFAEQREGCRVRTTHHSSSCMPKKRWCVVRTLRHQNPWLAAVLLGLLTGVSLCPPFLLAFGSAAQLPRVWQSLLFFGAFFVGTSVYIVPLPLVGLAGRHDAIRTVGRLAAGVAGMLYLYSGLTNIIGAIS